MSKKIDWDELFKSIKNLKDSTLMSGEEKLLSEEEIEFMNAFISSSVFDSSYIIKIANIAKQRYIEQLKTPKKKIQSWENIQSW